MNRSDIAAISHAVVFLLSLFGVVAKADMTSAEGVIAAAITAAVGLASQAVVIWKYLHHQWSEVDTQAAFDRGVKTGKE